METPSWFNEDDGLFMPEVGPWAELKLKRAGYYGALFSTSMKNHWDCRVYIDLFAGAGKARVRDTGTVLPGSPLLSLAVPNPFDKYVLCEQDAEKLDALRARIDAHYPGRDVSYVGGDVNTCVEEVLGAVPCFSKSRSGLALCFVDPYNKGHLQFGTIRRIAESLYVDFLVLIPTYMDIHRNKIYYTRPEDDSLDAYLGCCDWRERWPDPDRPSMDFGLFVAEEYCRQMAGLGFRFDGLEDLVLIRRPDDRNQPLYHLAFFSRSDLGLKFWRETRRNTNPQLSLLD